MDPVPPVLALAHLHPALANHQQHWAADLPPSLTPAKLVGTAHLGCAPGDAFQALSDTMWPGSLTPLAELLLGRCQHLLLNICFLPPLMVLSLAPHLSCMGRVKLSHSNPSPSSSPSPRVHLQARPAARSSPLGAAMRGTALGAWRPWGDTEPLCLLLCKGTHPAPETRAHYTTVAHRETRMHMQKDTGTVAPTLTHF